MCKEHYHHELSCPFAQNKVEVTQKKPAFNYQVKICDFCKGNIRNMEPIECDLCHGLYCLKCKFENDHNCPRKPIKKEKKESCCNCKKKIYIFFILLFLIIIVGTLIFSIYKRII